MLWNVDQFDCEEAVCDSAELFAVVASDLQERWLGEGKEFAEGSTSESGRAVGQFEKQGLKSGDSEEDSFESRSSCARTQRTQTRSLKGATDVE